MSLEETLTKWTGPSSDTEQEKQDRTERMVRQAIDFHEPFKNCSLKIYAKGSYANNTNVRSDSDVDIAVECMEALYWDESDKGTYIPGETYKGIWTPAKLRSELALAMEAKFPGHVDTSGSTAIQINSNSARVDADVVPCFSFKHYMTHETREGTKIFKTDGSSIINYPAQQMANGIAKNKRTGNAYKKGARLLKRIENAMAENGTFRELPSFFMECLAYNCPDAAFAHTTWTDCLRAMLAHIWTHLQGEEPESARWVEVNENFYLFHSAQKWSRKDGREFSQAAWNYLGLK
ncbi:nucleotidyltransferase [Pseudomonas alliivorans]|nr:nucleotidyltransferase [Pseudomonas alliivorans]MEE4795901.1 nucleotidyltransferase [Pseudomonas alliivorans]MEE4800928.1 nucleotidyltransferase [Pseudomonas alliivorans]MEE4810977.1 nucleotidyltransferase [Pseudomonas alliivorans]MEE4826156.1 nucleotidyltransferase [Pseudomonas alliivorans]